jgi:hypothetical protein
MLRKGELHMKRVFSVVLAAAMILLLAACQVTPEKPVVVKKDTERLIEQADGKGGKDIGKLGIPDGRYTFDTTGANGKLRIHADAAITNPDVSAMPIIKVSMGLFSQKQVTGIFNYLFPNVKPKYDFGQVETKADIKQEILEQKKQLASGDYEGSEEDLKKRIAQMEESYAQAPDAAPKGNISDGTLTKFGSDQNSTARNLSVSNEEYQLQIFTHTAKAGIKAMQMPSLSYLCKDQSRSYSTRNMTPTDGAALPEKAKSLTMAYDKAKALCEGFFASAGYAKDDFCIGSSYIIDDTGADEQPGTNFAYNLIYTRKVGGVPLFFDTVSLNADKDKAFTLPWSYESIEFVIDNKGIVSIFWRTPVDIGITINKTAALKNFDEIMDVFKAMVKTSYEGIVTTVFNEDATLDIEVNGITLCLLRIREQGGAQTDGLLIPAWVFTGRNKGTDKKGEIRYLQGASALSGFDFTKSTVERGGAALSNFALAPGVREHENVVLLAINAIDGSIIDLSKGY